MIPKVVTSSAVASTTASTVSTPVTSKPEVNKHLSGSANTAALPNEAEHLEFEKIPVHSSSYTPPTPPPTTTTTTTTTSETPEWLVFDIGIYDEWI